MANYKETIGTANAWRRCCKLIIDNSLITNNNHILLLEEDVVTIGDKTLRSDVGNIRASFDPSANIMLRDTTTGELTGGYLPQSIVYQALYSFYIAKALERDAAEASQV